MAEERLTKRVLIEEGWVPEGDRWYPPIPWAPVLGDLGKAHLLDEGVPLADVRQIRTDCLRAEEQARTMTRAGWFRKNGTWHMPGSWGVVRNKGTYRESYDGIGFEEAYRLFGGLRGYFPGKD